MGGAQEPPFPRAIIMKGKGHLLYQLTPGMAIMDTFACGSGLSSQNPMALREWCWTLHQRQGGPFSILIPLFPCDVSEPGLTTPIFFLFCVPP